MNDNRLILRGQIYHINLDPENKPIGSEMWPDRPGIIVSNNTNNQYSNTVEVVYLTTKVKKKYSPTHVKICPANKQKSLALCEQICTIDRSRLGDLIATASEADMELIDQALAISLGFSSTPHTANIFHKWELYINRYHLEIGMHLQKLFDDQFQIVSTTTDAPAATNSDKPEESSDEIYKMKQQLTLLTQEKDLYQSLHSAVETKLIATEEERDAYKQLYRCAKDICIADTHNQLPASVHNVTDKTEKTSL